MSTTFPSRSDYETAIRRLDVFAADAQIKNGKVLMRKDGLFPQAYSGGRAVVFPVIISNQKYALKCWIQSLGALEERYKAVSRLIREVKPTYLVESVYKEREILYNGTRYPVLQMQWSDSLTLKEWLFANISDSQKIRRLAEGFLDVVSHMHSIGMSHGDLQHENILVDSGSGITLVDYDSIYLPGLEHLDDEIKGLPGYQHSSRSSQIKANSKSDYTSEYVIYISLMALAENPDLWHLFKDHNRLIFSQQDIIDPRSSNIFKALRESTSLSPIVDAFEAQCLCKTLIDIEPIERACPTTVEPSLQQRIPSRSESKTTSDIGQATISSGKPSDLRKARTWSGSNSIHSAWNFGLTQNPANDLKGNSSYSETLPLTIFTLGHFIERDIAANVRQRRDRLEAIKFEQFSLILQTSSGPCEIDKQTIVGWKGDAGRIELVLTSDWSHKIVLIKPLNYSDNPNKLVDIIQQFKVYGIDFITEGPSVFSEKKFQQSHASSSERIEEEPSTKSSPDYRSSNPNSSDYVSSKRNGHDWPSVMTTNCCIESSLPSGMRKNQDLTCISFERTFIRFDCVSSQGKKNQLSIAKKRFVGWRRVGDRLELVATDTTGAYGVITIFVKKAGSVRLIDHIANGLLVAEINSDSDVTSRVNNASPGCESSRLDTSNETSKPVSKPSQTDQDSSKFSYSTIGDVAKTTNRSLDDVRNAAKSLNIKPPFTFGEANRLYEILFRDPRSARGFDAARSYENLGFSASSRNQNHESNKSSVQTTPDNSSNWTFSYTSTSDISKCTGKSISEVHSAAASVGASPPFTRIEADRIAGRLVGDPSIRRSYDRLYSKQGHDKPHPSRANSKSDNDCFIATAIYGDPYHPDLVFLRGYRDDVLKASLLGRTFVFFYYRISPSIAFLIDKSGLGPRLIPLMSSVVHFVATAKRKS